MRLIDADKFKENILSGLYIFCQENKEDIARAIDDEPTIAVNCDDCDGYEAGYTAGLHDDIRHQGTWIYQDYNYTCSNCHNPALEQEEYPYLSSYCPFCGAEMEIEK